MLDGLGADIVSFYLKSQDPGLISHPKLTFTCTFIAALTEWKLSAGYRHKLVD